MICADCGICCSKTEMLITDDDIKIILKKYPKQLKVDDFAFKNKEGFWQLKNINKYCFFFNNNTKECSIYEFRPEGCRYYPLIYLTDIKICSLDTDCPRRDEFYAHWKERRSVTNNLMRYLKRYGFID